MKKPLYNLDHPVTFQNEKAKVVEVYSDCTYKIIYLERDRHPLYPVPEHELISRQEQYNDLMTKVYGKY